VSPYTTEQERMKHILAVRRANDEAPPFSERIKLPFCLRCKGSGYDPSGFGGG
jgi:hypothetical protein